MKSNKKISGYTVMIIISIILVLIFALLLLKPSRQKTEIILPDLTAVPDNGQTGNKEGGWDSKLIRAEVNNRTVQSVIASLERPDSYIRSIEIKKYWEGGEARYLVDVYTLEDKTRLAIAHEGYETQNILINSDKVYIWYNNESDYLELNRWEEEELFQIADSFQMIDTYEDVIELNRDNIVDSGYRERDGRYYIYVQTEDELFGYTSEYFISTETGLLEFAEKKDGEFTIYKMGVNNEYLERPAEQVFKHP